MLTDIFLVDLEWMSFEFFAPIDDIGEHLSSDQSSNIVVVGHDASIM